MVNDVLPGAGKGLRTKRFIKKHQLICYYDGDFSSEIGKNAIDSTLYGSELYIYVEGEGLKFENDAATFLFYNKLTHYTIGTPGKSPNFLIKNHTHTHVHLIPKYYTPGLFANDAAYYEGIDKYTYKKRIKLNNAVLVPVLHVDAFGTHSVYRYALIASKDIHPDTYIYTSYGHQFWDL